jgi:hypothetical protein
MWGAIPILCPEDEKKGAKVKQKGRTKKVKAKWKQKWKLNAGKKLLEGIASKTKYNFARIRGFEFWISHCWSNHFKS